MNKNDELMDRELREMLKPLNQVPPRSKDRAASGRESYMSRVESLTANTSKFQAVSASPFHRLNGWINQLRTPLTRKERVPVFSLISIVVIGLSILFGGAGVTVYAAQDDLPDEALYQVKLRYEYVVSGLQEGSTWQNRLSWELTKSDRRMDEIIGLMDKNKSVPPEAIARYKDQLETVFELVLTIGDPVEQTEAVEKVGIHIRDQDRLVELRDYDGLRLRYMYGDPADEDAQLLLSQLVLIDPSQVISSTFGYSGTLGISNAYQFSGTHGISNAYGISGTFGISNAYQFSGTHGISNAYGISGTFGISNSYNFSGTHGISNSYGTQYGVGPSTGPGPEAGPGPDAGPGPEAGPGPDAGPGPAPEVTPEPEAGPGPDAGPGPAPVVTPEPGGDGSDTGAGGSTNPVVTQPPSNSGGGGKP